MIRSADEIRFALTEICSEVTRLEAAELPTVAGAAEQLKATIGLRITVAARETEQAAEDQLLTAEGLAKMFSVSVDTVYRTEYPFAVRISAKCVRYSRAGAFAWIKSRQSRRRAS